MNIIQVTTDSRQHCWTWQRFHCTFATNCTQKPLMWVMGSLLVAIISSKKDWKQKHYSQVWLPSTPPVSLTTKQSFLKKSHKLVSRSIFRYFLWIHYGISWIANKLQHCRNRTRQLWTIQRKTHTCASSWCANWQLLRRAPKVNTLIFWFFKQHFWIPLTSNLMESSCFPQPSTENLESHQSHNSSNIPLRDLCRTSKHRQFH